MIKRPSATMLSLGALLLIVNSFGFSTDKLYGKFMCDDPAFTCIDVPEGSTWAKLFPNKREREMVKRLNRTNMSVRYREWIAIPKALSTVSLRDLSPFPLHHDTHGKPTLIVKLNLLAFAAYDAQGNLVHWGPISGGKDWCKDTNEACQSKTGVYKIYRKQGAECTSSQFPIETNGGAPMPYCMHYVGGYALHGSTLPGYHDSHGCIRLFNDDAMWLNKHFLKIGSRIEVSDDSKDQNHQGSSV